MRPGSPSRRTAHESRNGNGDTARRVEVHRLHYDSAGRLKGEDTFDGRRLRYRNDPCARPVRIEDERRSMSSPKASRSVLIAKRAPRAQDGSTGEFSWAAIASANSSASCSVDFEGAGGSCCRGAQRVVALASLPAGQGDNWFLGSGWRDPACGNAVSTGVALEAGGRGGPRRLVRSSAPAPPATTANGTMSQRSRRPDTTAPQARGSRGVCVIPLEDADAASSVPRRELDVNKCILPGVAIPSGRRTERDLDIAEWQQSGFLRGAARSAGRGPVRDTVLGRHTRVRPAVRYVTPK